MKLVSWEENTLKINPINLPDFIYLRIILAEADGALQGKVFKVSLLKSLLLKQFKKKKKPSYNKMRLHK